MKKININTLLKMKDKSIQSQGNTLTLQKSKRRDRFESAPINRNIFISTNLKQYSEYTQQNTQGKTNQNKLTQNQPQITYKQHQIPINYNKQKTKIWLDNNVLHIKNTTVENLQDKDQNINDFDQKNNQNIDLNQNNFIFQQVCSSQEEQLDHNIENPGPIIFQDEDDHENLQQIHKKMMLQQQQRQMLEKLKYNQEILNKRTILLFGEKIQVHEQHEDNKQQYKNKNNKNTTAKKQLLKATTNLPQNIFVKMMLTRFKSNLHGQIFLLNLQNNKRLILACKRQSGQSYLLSQNPDVFQQNGEYSLGKIKYSYFGNQLNLFTKGPNPLKSKQLKIPPRQLICTVITHPQQIMQQIRPRQFTVYLLKPGLSYYKDLIGVNEQQIQLNKLYHEYQTNKDKIIVFQNRKSQWCQQMKVYSLNMKGRAGIPSIKNYILQSPQQNRREVMLFGKMGENSFSFDIHSPLSSVIGMAIAMSSFTHSSW